MTRRVPAVDAARPVDGPERRPPGVGKRSRVFHKRPPAIISVDHQKRRSGHDGLRGEAGVR